jgi:hypothetical protein
MRLLRVVALSLCLTAPLTALAQAATDAPRDTPPETLAPLTALAQATTEAPAAPPLSPLAATSTEPPHEMRAPIGCRISGETLGGALVGSSGLALGFLGGFLLADSVSCGIDDCNQGRRITLGVGAAGLGLGAASGVYLAGALMNARGRYLPTLLGGLAGAALPLAVSGITGADIESAPLLVSFLALPVAGAILGYELSNPLTRQRSERAATAVVPTVALAPGGGGLGLAGRF